MFFEIMFFRRLFGCKYAFMHISLKSLFLSLFSLLIFMKVLSIVYEFLTV